MGNGERSPRQLILCCDGTNNTLTGGAKDTNVLRLFERLRATDDGRRVLYYDPGVGTADELPPTDAVQWMRRKWDRLSGLASGQGVFENISQAYSFLMREWREGDSVWLFGFSRGAFTARSIAGIVHLFGIVRPEHRALLPTLMRIYFSSKDGSTLAMRAIRRIAQALSYRDPGQRRDRAAEQVRELFTTPAGRTAAVHFVGVWDTVESVGLPGFGLHISSQATIRAKRIQHVRHALSLDEHRWPFLPRLYDDEDFGDAKHPGADHGAAQSMRQVWFRGVHSDVGGGYDADAAALSDAALQWMLAEANACGLACPPETDAKPRTARQVAHDPLHETPWWAVTGMTVRATAPRGRATAIGTAHESVQSGHARSMWSERRPILPLLVAATGGALALVLSGYMLMPAGGWRGFHAFATTPSQWVEAMVIAKNLAVAQATTWFDARGAFDVASEDGACPRRALLFDMAFIAAYAYVLARLCSRAFARRFTWREVDGLPPKLRLLGFSLSTLVAGDFVENVLGIAAFSCGRGVFGQGFLCLGAFGSFAKFVGFAGCVALIVLGWSMPGSLVRRAPRSDAH